MDEKYKHEHPTVYLGQMAGEYGGTYPIRWCRECGTVFMFSGNHAYELVPEWVESKVKESKITYVRDEPKPKKLPQRVLGRGLRELMASHRR